MDKDASAPASLVGSLDFVELDWGQTQSKVCLGCCSWAFVESGAVGCSGSHAAPAALPKCFDASLQAASACSMKATLRFDASLQCAPSRHF